MEKSKQAEFRKLSRQVDEANQKIHNNGYRIKNTSPNLYNNRLQRIKDFCNENGLTNCSYLKYSPLTDNR